MILKIDPVNITREEIGELQALLKVSVSKDDYLDTYETSLKELSKKVSIKGFRPGKVPKNLVRKMYGDAILAEELDKIVRKELNQYIQDEKLRILGSPMPTSDEAITIDSKDLGDYDFTYELGLSPEIEVSALSTSTELPQYKIKVEDERIDKEWDQLLRQHGELSDVGAVGEGDLIYLKLVEADDKGEIKPDGVFKDSVINQDMIKDEDLAKEVIDMVPGDTIQFTDLAKALDREPDSVVQYMLGLKGEEAENVSMAFRGEITNIKRNTPAEANQELFDKVFGAGKVSSEEDARKEIEEGIRRAYDSQTERHVNDELVGKLLENTEVPLPEPFLAKWLLSQKQSEAANSEDKDAEIPQEVSDEEFEHFRRNLKWSLIYNKVASDKSLEVSREEIEEAAKGEVARHYGPALAQLPPDELSSLVNRLLGDRDYMERLHSGILDQKVFEAMRGMITLKEEEVSVDDFREIMTKTKAPISA